MFERRSFYYLDWALIGAVIALYGAAWTIVGIVADEKTRGLSEAAPLAAYLPLAQSPSFDGAGVLMVRTANDPLVARARMDDPWARGLGRHWAAATWGSIARQAALKQLPEAVDWAL